MIVLPKVSTKASALFLLTLTLTLITLQGKMQPKDYAKALLTRHVDYKNLVQKLRSKKTPLMRKPLPPKSKQKVTLLKTNY